MSRSGKRPVQESGALAATGWHTWIGAAERPRAVPGLMLPCLMEACPCLSPRICSPSLPASGPKASRQTARPSMCGSAAGPGRRAAARLRRNRRHVGAARGGLARDHTVIVPDLRGMGLSSRPAGGYDKKTQGQDIAGVLDALRDRARRTLSRHDIGNMVGYAFAAQYPDRVTRLVLMDAPLPGIGPWDEILKNPLLWHFRFGGPDMERLVAGPRAHLSRPLLERVLGRPEGFRRSLARALRRALRAARRDARRLRAVRRLRSGRASTTRRSWPRAS